MYPGPEQRKWVRYPANPHMCCDLLTSGAMDIQAVAVRNISQGGAQLVVDVLIPTGLVLWVRFHNPVVPLLLWRQVRAVYTYRGPDWHYVLGVAFLQELCPEEVEGLQQAAPAAASTPAAPPVAAQA